MNAVPRFLVLDSWRGICACLVAMYHLTQYTSVLDVSFIRNSFLFVDFFFVLSGFVITANYADRFASGLSIKDFMILRFGRIYPLHIFTLTMFVLFAIIRLLKSNVDGVPPFKSDAEDPYAIITNILLIHSLGFHDHLSWNFPSWSISTEFYVYFIFAVMAMLSRLYFNLMMVLFIIAGPILIGIFSPDNMAATYDYGFIRCLYGFGVGSVLWQIHKKRLCKRDINVKTNIILWTVIEMMTVIFITIYVIFAQKSLASLIAPIVFSVVIYCFIAEKGFMSRMLSSRLFVGVGDWSYSIYMMHALVFFVGFQSMFAVHRYLGVEWFGVIDGATYVGGNPVADGLIYAVMMCLTIACARLTYRTIEAPGRAYFRRFVKGGSVG